MADVPDAQQIVIVQVEHWGLIDYREALLRQEQLVEEIAAARAPERLIVCSHPEVVTLGRATSEQDVLDWAGDTVSVSRGGRATFHGPNQIIVYPILKTERVSLAAILRGLEQAVIAWLLGYGVTNAEARPLRVLAGESEAKPATGVWVGERKIAAIGLAVRKWVSYHGLAVNFDVAPKAAVQIRPCGFQPGSVTSLLEVLRDQMGQTGSVPDRKEAEAELVRLISTFCRY